MALNFLNNGYFAGKVGIGAESPSRNLQVKGTANTAIAITAPTTGLAQLALGDTDDDNYAQILLDNSTNKLQIQNGGGGVVSNRGITLDSSENVGIGTASPSRPLHVNGGALNFVAEFQSTDDKASILIQDDDTLNYIHSQDGYLSLGGQSLLSASNLNINSSSGNVGIGTASPSEKLTVAGNVESQDTIILNYNNAGNKWQQLFDGSNAWNLRYYNSTTQAWSSNYVNVNTSGNAAFAGSIYAANVIGNITAGSLGQQMEKGNASVTTLRFDANRWRLYAGASAGEVFTVEETGNVGINNTGPDYKLEVNGTFGVSDLPGNVTSVSALVADEITGVELVTNGDFSNGQTGWSFQTGWAVSNGGATVSTAGVTSRVAQTLSYVANISTTTKFRYKFEITNITAGSLRLFVNKPTFTEIANVNAVGKYEYDVEVNTGSNGIFYLYSTSSSGNTFQGTVTNVSVKEITPVSNQIQKRELGTGAFGPTPVGAYLPLTAGSGSPLTGTLYGTSTNYSGSGDYAGNLTLGTGASTQEAHLQIGQGRTGNGYSYIDLIGDATYTDYGLRVIRNNTGANTTSAIIHRGTGNLEISTVESASVLFKTNNTSAFSLTNTQNAIFEGYVGIGGTNPGANLEIRGTVNTDDCKIYLKENDLYGAYFKYDGDLNRGYIGGITGTTSENAVMSWSRAGSDLKLVTSGSTAVTIDSNRDVTFAENITIKDVLLSNQVNTDIDTGAEVVAQVAHATYTAAFFDFVVKKGTNVRSGTVYACHDGDTTPLVEFTETSTNDLGDTSDVTLSVDISGANMRLLATVTSDDWSVKSLIRAI